MRRAAHLTLTAFALTIAVAAQPPPPPAAPAIVASRPRLIVGDPWRSRVVVWSPTASLPLFGPNLSPPIYTLGTTRISRDPTTGWGEDWWDATLHGTVTLPAAVAPGSYTLNCGTVSLPLTVVAPVKPGSAKALTPTATIKDINKAIADGHPVALAPGEYTLDGTLNPDRLPNVTVRGYGAVLRWTPGGSAIGVGDDMTIEGLTLDAPGRQYTLDDGHGDLTGSRGLVLYRVTTTPQTQLWWGGRELWVEQCTFNGSCTAAGQGAWINNVFRGGRGGGTSFSQNQYGSGSAVVDNLWDGADRGPTVNLSGGSSYDASLYLWNALRGIRRGLNGSESWLCEGGAFNRCLILHTQSYGCIGSFCQWDGGGVGNRVWDARVDGYGVNLMGPVTGCEFKGVSVPAIRLGAQTARVVFADCTAALVDDKGTGNDTSGVKPPVGK